jgi:3-isopropylmalate/(R)-2-methylmalate dehydratase large subunit
MPAIIYIDLHLVHEVTSPQGFDLLRAKGVGVRRPERTLATLDHATPTLPAKGGKRPYITDQARRQVHTLRRNCREFGIELADWDSPERGIVHVMGPEQGATQPGMTIVCGDSHTSTHGAFGALAFGIGTTEVGHVLATQCLLQNKPKSMRIRVKNRLRTDVSAKDLALHIINHLGMNGGTGYVIEYAGEAVRAMDMESRMTLCNLTIEAGARAGMIAPDATTVEYLRGRARVPIPGQGWGRAVARWLELRSDPGAAFDKEIEIDGAMVRPTITYGTDPGMSIPIREHVPAPANATQEKALRYMGFEAGDAMTGRKVDVVFIGSCTNGRISDLRAAAEVLRGRRIAEHVRMLVVPGSEAVRQQAEVEGLHDIITAAGGEWRLPGCSMCIAMNGDIVPAGMTAVSTSNRNFEGRQGAGSRTLLASPATAAASAVLGRVARAADLATDQETR